MSKCIIVRAWTLKSGCLHSPCGENEDYTESTFLASRRFSIQIPTRQGFDRDQTLFRFFWAKCGAERICLQLVLEASQLHLWASPAPDGRIDRLLTGEEATGADLLLEQTRKEPMSPMLVLSCRARSVCGGRRFAPMPERLLPFPMAELTVATDGSCKWCLPAQRLDQLDCCWHLGDFDVAAKCGSADAGAERRNDKEQSRLPLPVR
jgi:hypothetical protein